MLHVGVGRMSDDALPLLQGAVVLRRDWRNAQAKREGGCRVCGRPEAELAHVIGRANDRRSGNVAVVDADSVIGLCKAHHVAYDSRTLDLMPYLAVEEQARAVLDAGGIEAARRRIIGRAA